MLIFFLNDITYNVVQIYEIINYIYVLYILYRSLKTWRFIGIRIPLHNGVIVSLLHSVNEVVCIYNYIT